MKIQNVSRTDRGIQLARETAVHDTAGGRPLAFRKTLTDMSHEQHMAHMRAMKEAIDDQARLLADRKDIREFERYRQLVRDFLDEIVSNGYTFSKETSYASRGRHRFTATVNTINEKLDEIGKEFMKEHAETIDVLDKIDDIRGLLLDLMM